MAVASELAKWDATIRQVVRSDDGERRKGACQLPVRSAPLALKIRVERERHAESAEA
jgi:hypothetical protein